MSKPIVCKETRRISPTFGEIKPGTKFKVVHILDHLIWDKKRIYTKLPDRLKIGFDQNNNVDVFANATCREFTYDFADEVSVEIIK